MSKIARLPITVPSGVTVDVVDSLDFIKIKSGSAELSYPFHHMVELKKSDDGIYFDLKDVRKKDRTLRSIVGTIYASVKRAIDDVQNKFTAKIQLKGVGYRGVYANNMLTLFLGFSHAVKVAIPKDIEVKVTQNTNIDISGYDRRVVMSIVMSIRSLRKPEPYKGKGVFVNGGRAGACLGTVRGFAMKILLRPKAYSSD